VENPYKSPEPIDDPEDRMSIGLFITGVILAGILILDLFLILMLVLGLLV
jgi:hypothetical protein